MARNKRWRAAGLTQLVWMRGHNQETVLRSSRDAQAFIACLAEAALDTGDCDLHAFSLMPTEVVVLCTGRIEGGVGRFVQSVGRSYTPLYNRWHGRSGALWNGRYRAAVVEPGAWVLAAQRYVESLAERRGVSPAWTSARLAPRVALAGCLRPHPSLQMCQTGLLRHASPLVPVPAIALRDEMVDEIELAMAHGLAVGSDAFKDQVAALCGARARLGRAGRPPRLATASEAA